MWMLGSSTERGGASGNGDAREDSEGVTGGADVNEPSQLNTEPPR
jgi:hypothetical protein